ncbi:efflux RND transporter periplasmic adaptor subunit [Thermomonas sp.]|uniref:efflux RND transporter periplasmic adaptor subunit n=1 Tax=Thermomonas sp. TaxID=1971895 RepID=UPI0024882652|nr:efflux RND transporter periplasmic adaptor subunit [Thermomonas sp.]MDI1251798.1 efflux RND transporter periplasmic adaptor subunit [Thermomonas sp.]
MLPSIRNLFLACMSLAILTGCGNDKGAAGPGARGMDRPVPVTTQVVQPREFSDTLRALGTVHAREAVTITAKVSETVQQVHFDSGDTVVRGAPLVSLSGQQQQAAMSEAQAAASEATRLYQRQSDLAAQQLIARASLDAQAATRDAANARVAQIRAQLADRVIRAPFAGVLGIRKVSPGALVTPGTAIATLDDIARVYVDFPLPESDLALAGVGQRVSGSSSSWPGRSFDGTVSAIDPRIDAASRALTVRADFPNPDQALRPGMLVEVSLHRAARQALLLPEIAVVQVGDKTFVWLVGADGKVAQADVKIGVRRDGMAEVVSGLTAGDRIVVEGTGKLRAGNDVQDAANEKAAPTPALPRKQGRE